MLNEIYVDNYKGFSNQYVNLERANFFVGENSSGKSSIINLIDVVLNMDYINFNNTPWYDTLFDDLKTKRSKKRFVNVGFSDTIKESIFDGNDKWETKLTKMFFYFRVGCSHDGFPLISKGLLFNARTSVILGFSFDKNGAKTFAQKNQSFHSLGGFIAKVEILRFRKEPENLIFFQNKTLSNIFLKVADANGELRSFSGFRGNTSAKRFSPIRSLPKAIYNKTREHTFSSFGEHIPNTLASFGQKNSKFSSVVNKFGLTSGLFDKIGIKYLSKGITSQFTIQVFRGNTETRIDQVGTGVGQVLPIICETLNVQIDTIFLFQQPELHLHPKAQSALGEFLFEIKEKEKNYSFIAETHSEYLIDSFRRETGKKKRQDALILFFSEEDNLKKIEEIRIDKEGKYYGEGLSKFRKFYLDESIRNLNL
jgi:predicted ATP-dependent endonuclease of OLD family